MEGEHDLQTSFDVTEEVLRTVFDKLYQQQVMLEGMILKPNMVIPGLNCPNKATVDEVAEATIKCLLQSVPAAVSGIAFLSGDLPIKLTTYVARHSFATMLVRGGAPMAFASQTLGHSNILTTQRYFAGFDLVAHAGYTKALTNFKSNELAPVKNC